MSIRQTYKLPVSATNKKTQGHHLLLPFTCVAVWSVLSGLCSSEFVAYSTRLLQVDQLFACSILMIWCDLQVYRESQLYESTLQKMNQQLQASLDLMAGEKAALQLSLAGLQEQFEGVAQAVYTADEAVVGQTLCSARV